METVQWHEKIKRQLEVVQRWRQSGKSIAAWAQAHGVDAKLLMGWVRIRRAGGKGWARISLCRICALSAWWRAWV
jgi:transposase-like protein